MIGIGLSSKCLIIKKIKVWITEAKNIDKTTVIVVETDREQRVPGYESWWDVPVAEVSTIESVRQARADYEDALKKERHHL